MRKNLSSLSNLPLLIPVSLFARQIGRTPVTVWRWQRLGWLDAPINIAGKPYLKRESIERWAARAEAGEFARAPHVPRKAKLEVAI